MGWTQLLVTLAIIGSTHAVPRSTNSLSKLQAIEYEYDPNAWEGTYDVLYQYTYSDPPWPTPGKIKHKTKVVRKGTKKKAGTPRSHNQIPNNRDRYTYEYVPEVDYMYHYSAAPGSNSGKIKHKAKVTRVSKKKTSGTPRLHNNGGGDEYMYSYEYIPEVAYSYSYSAAPGPKPGKIKKKVAGGTYVSKIKTKKRIGPSQRTNSGLDRGQIGRGGIIKPGSFMAPNNFRPSQALMTLRPTTSNGNSYWHTGPWRYPNTASNRLYYPFTNYANGYQNNAWPYNFFKNG